MVIERALVWLNSKDSLVDSPELSEEELQAFKVRFLDVLLLVWSRRSLSRGSRRFDKSALCEMAKMYLVDLCRRVRKLGLTPGYRNLMEELKSCKSASEEIGMIAIAGEALHKAFMLAGNLRKATLLS